MSPTNPRQTLLAVNSTEWLKLCARGSIRLSKRRPVLTSNPASDREMEKVFASAPFTKLDSSVDLFVIVIKDDWPNSKKRHRTGSSEIFLLNLSDVSKHHPVAQQHVDYYGPMASKFGVQLEEPIFEKPWLYWITNETIQDSCDAAELLQNNFKVNSSTNTKRVDKYKWSDIARLVLRPNEKIKTKPAPIESLLSNIRKIADAVSSARDSEQFYLACAIEWIDVRLNKDPLQKKGCKKVLATEMTDELWELWEAKAGELIGADKKYAAGGVPTGLLRLHGVGYPVATALLGLLKPEVFPVMDRWAIEAIFGKGASKKRWQTKAKYREYTQLLVTPKIMELQKIETLRGRDKAAMNISMGVYKV